MAIVHRIIPRSHILEKDTQTNHRHQLRHHVRSRENYQNQEIQAEEEKEVRIHPN